jgi:hypothetical protein
MRLKKLISTCAVGAMGVALIAAPGALGVKSPKLVGGTVSVNVTPNPLPNTTTTVTASGNLATNSSCRKLRTVRFYWVVSGVQGAEIGSTVTGSNGDYTATLPRPTETAPTTTSVTLRAIVDQTFRKVGSKKKGRKDKKGRQFNCLSVTGDSAPVTLTEPTV